MARYTHRRRRRTFSKRQAKAIQAIAQKPIETKIQWDYTDPANRYVPGATVATTPAITVHNSTEGRCLINLHSNMDREAALSTPGVAPDVEGMYFQSVGVRFRWFTEVMGTRNYRWRLTIFSSGQKFESSASTTSLNQITNTDYTWMEQGTAFSQPTVQNFNTRNVRILKQFTRSSTVDGNTAKVFKGWIPIRGRKSILRQEGNTVVQDKVGALVGRNYYAMMEWYAPRTGSYTPSTTDYMRSFLEWDIYYKDA